MRMMIMMIMRMKHTNQIHAPLPAVVPSCEPVPLCLPQHLLVALPAEPVCLVLERGCSYFALPFSARQGLWEANLPLVTVGVDIVPRPVLGQGDYDGFSSPRPRAELSRHGQTGHQGQQQGDR